MSGSGNYKTVMKKPRPTEAAMKLHGFAITGRNSSTVSKYTCPCPSTQILNIFVCFSEISSNDSLVRFRLLDFDFTCQVVSKKGNMYYKQNA